MQLIDRYDRIIEKLNPSDIKEISDRVQAALPDSESPEYFSDAQEDEEQNDIEEEFMSGIIENDATGKVEMIDKSDANSRDDVSIEDSEVVKFLEKYANGNHLIQILRTDLMKIAQDICWIQESGNENEQFALDFVDALNELSISICN